MILRNAAVVDFHVAAHRVANDLTAMTNGLVILAKACGKSNVKSLNAKTRALSPSKPARPQAFGSSGAIARLTIHAD